jgi:SEC-C motif
MGAIADAMVAYVQHLLDKSDGSPDQVQKAFALGQLCWNLALLPPFERDIALEDMRTPLNMDDEAFEEFRRDIVGPMIQRHAEMFPQMHRRASSRIAAAPSILPTRSTPPPLTRERPRAGRNSPCPCNSGRKYKHCCGR